MVNNNSSIAIDPVKPKSNLNCNAVDAYCVSNIADLLHNVSMNCSEFVLANDGHESVVGELMSCDDCGCELEVLGLKPVSLGEAPEAEEDWGE